MYLEGSDTDPSLRGRDEGASCNTNGASHPLPTRVCEDFKDFCPCGKGASASNLKEVICGFPFTYKNPPITQKAIVCKGFALF